MELLDIRNHLGKYVRWRENTGMFYLQPEDSMIYFLHNNADWYSGRWSVNHNGLAITIVTYQIEGGLLLKLKLQNK